MTNFGDRPEVSEMLYCHDCEAWVTPWVPVGMDCWAGHTGYVCTQCSAGLGADRVLLLPGLMPGQSKPIAKPR